MNRKNVATLLWKELVDLLRDRRTLFSIILIPLIVLPGMGLVIGFMFQSQPPIIVIVAEDGGTPVNQLIQLIDQYSQAHGGGEIIVTNDTRSIPKEADLIVVIPRGFSENITRLNTTAHYTLNKTVGTSKSDLALTIVQQSFSDLESFYVEWRVQRIAGIVHNETGITIDVKKLLNPVEIKELGYRTQSGGKASQEEEYLYLTMMVLIISLFMSISPPISFVSDSVAGERERKTLECLLVAPATRGEILASKLIASLVLSLAASGASTLGAFLMYLLMFSGMLGEGVKLPVTLDLIAIFGLTIFLTVMVTVSIALLISCLADSIRGAHSNSVGISLASSFIMFAALYGDLERLDPPLKALVYMVPYTHSVLILSKYLKEGVFGIIPHTVILLAFIGLMTYLSYRVFRSERILYGKRVRGRKKLLRKD